VLVYAVEGTAEYGWGSARTLVLLALAAGLLATFAAVERASAQPLVPPVIWRVRSLTAAATVMLGATGILVGAFFLNSLYLQGVLGWSALESGFAFVPLVLAIGIAAHLAPHLLGHAGARVVAVVGLAATAVGALLLALAPDQAIYAVDLLPGFIVLGLGIGLVFPAAQVSAMHDVAPEQAGLASGVMSTAHEIGAALGVAVLSAIAATGAGAVTGAGLASGYGDGFLVAAIAAAALAVVGLLAVPAIRPAAGIRPVPH
jgi:Na+/melibiose symporter-like transporter